jgi:hypothetical protein
MQTQYDELYHVIDMQMTPLVHIGGPFGLVLLHRIHSRLGMIPNMGQKNYSKSFQVFCIPFQGQHSFGWAHHGLKLGPTRSFHLESIDESVWNQS